VTKLKRHLTVANVLSITAVFIALSATAVAATKLGVGQVKSVNIARQAVTNAKIKTEAVTSGKIKNGGVNAKDLGAGQVTSEKIATGAVTGKKIGKKAVSPRTIAEEAVTSGKLANESVVASKLAPSFYAQLIKNVTYANGESASNNEVAKSAEAICPSGKQAIGGGARVNGELQDVAITGSNPASSGATRTGWSAFARDVDNVPGGNWSVEAFAVCAEL
jgi:trimeric autotransporter adhesin